MEIRNPHKNNEISYARSLDPGRFYPRFHIYIEEVKPRTDSQSEFGAGVIFDLHLDQKRPIYEGVTAHSGEYDGEVVEREAERIRKAALVSS